MKIAVVSSLAHVPADLGRSWRFSAERDFMLSYEWFDTLAQTALPPGREPRIYVAYDELGNAVAALPCAVDTRQRRLSSLTSFYSTAFSIHACCGLDDESRESTGAKLRTACEAFVEFICDERPRWAEVELRFLSADSAVKNALRDALLARDLMVEEFFQYENWFTRTAGLSFADYFAMRPSQLRNTIRRRERRLRQSHRVRIEIARDLAGGVLDKRIDDFVSIYNRSWKKPEPFPKFIPALCRAAAATGALRLGILYANDVPAAAQLWLTSKSKALIYKLAYDEAFREYSVGSILSAELFRIAIDEDRVQEIDYGIGGEAYKRDWMTDMRRIVGLSAVDPLHWRAWPLALHQAASRVVKRWRRRVRQTG